MFSRKLRTLACSLVTTEYARRGCTILFFILLCFTRSKGQPPALSEPSKRIERPRLVTQIGHHHVDGLSFSPDGRQIVSSGEDDSLRLWDCSTGRLIRTFQEAQPGSELVFSADGHYFFSRTGFAVNAWDIYTGIQAQHLELDVGEILSFAFSADAHYGLGLRSALDGDEFILWDLVTRKVVRTFSRPKDDSLIDSVDLSPDLRHVLALAGNYIEIWDLETGKLIHVLGGHTDYVRTARFSPQDQYVLSQSSDHTVRLWETTSGKELWKLEEPSSGYQMPVAFSHDGHVAFVSGDDKTIKMLEIPSGKIIKVFSGHPDDVTSIAVSRDGTYLISGTDKGGMILWNIASGEPVRTISGQTQAAVAVNFSPDRNYIYSVGPDHNIERWNLKTGKATEGRLDPLDWDRYIHWDGYSESDHAPNSQEEWRLHAFLALSQNNIFGAANAAFSEDGKLAVVGGYDQPMVLWDLTSMREVRQFPSSSTWATCLAFSRDSRYVLSGSDGVDNGPALTLWDISTGQRFRSFTEPNRSLLSGAVTSCAVSRDGSRALTGSEDKVLRLWDLSTGKVEWTFGSSFYFATAVAFSHNGRLAASGSLNGDLELWDLSLRKKLHHFQGHRSGVTAVAFSPRDRYLLSGAGGETRFDDTDDTLKLWDVTNGQKLRTFDARSRVMSVGFSPDEQFVISGNQDGTVPLWPIGTSPQPKQKSSNTRNPGTGGTTERPLCVMVSFLDGGWAVFDSEGRFDTHDLEEVTGLHWIMPNDPLRPKSLEIFMREYYEPGLLARAIAGSSLRHVRNLEDLNVVQPLVQIVVEPSSDAPDRVSVTANISMPISQREMASVRAYGLRVFRNGQLVGYAPQNCENAGPCELPLDSSGKGSFRFENLRLPHKSGQDDVEFSAYVFNGDGVKSATGRSKFHRPNLAQLAHPRAYIISFGVNIVESPGWDLTYAANDARMVQGVLSHELTKTGNYEEVIPVALISDDDKDGTNAKVERTATRLNLSNVLKRLAGGTVSSSALASIPGADRIQKATPDDLVILWIASHGYTDPTTGVFYVIPYDTGKTTGPKLSVLSHAISSDDLALWLRDIDAADIVMVIDACHSAASVEGEGFRAGPLGSRGLGQLSYDKGMRVLAATQSDSIANESTGLQHGLLTAALMVEGIQNHQAADATTNGEVIESQWLKYGSERVPKLSQEMKDGTLQVSSNGQIPTVEEQSSSVSRGSRSEAQQPALFDFSRTEGDAILAVADPADLPPFRWQDKNDWIKFARLLSSFCRRPVTEDIRAAAKNLDYDGVQTLACQEEHSDVTEAKRLWQFAATQQWPAGLYKAAALENDSALRRKKLSEVAQDEIPDAQFDLALMLMKGEGGDIDRLGARLLLLQAAEVGHPWAILALVKVYTSGDPIFGKATGSQELEAELLVEAARVGSESGSLQVVQSADHLLDSLAGLPESERSNIKSKIANYLRNAHTKIEAEKLPR